MGLARSLFAGPLGSLIHPVLMPIVIIGWVRSKRLEDADSAQPLLGDGRSVAGALGVRHHKVSAALLALTVAGMLLAMANTFVRTGRLFPGPHLYGALTLVLVLSLQVALVPHMKSGVQVRQCDYFSSFLKTLSDVYLKYLSLSLRRRLSMMLQVCRVKSEDHLIIGVIAVILACSQIVSGIPILFSLIASF